MRDQSRDKKTKSGSSSSDVHVEKKEKTNLIVEAGEVKPRSISKKKRFYEGKKSTGLEDRRKLNKHK